MYITADFFPTSVKPAFEVIDRLINRVWRTNVHQIVEDGTLSIRTFLGKYDFTVSANGKTLKTETEVTKGSSNILEIVI